MSLEDEINDRLVTDQETILKSEIDRVEKIIQIHQDGTIDIQGPYRKASDENKILAYLVGRYYAAEGGVVDTAAVDSSFFYDRLPVSERSVRRRLETLRDEGLAKKSGQSSHELIAENLPDALNRIEQEVSG
jgi:hypothetical protein